MCYLTQTCRLTSDSGNKQYKHIHYWLGLYVREYFPDMAMGPHAELISPYFFHMKALLVGGILLGDVKARRLGETTAKNLYASFTSSFPPAKIEYKFADVEWSRVWRRLQSPMLEAGAREIFFLLINNIIANRDRLFSKFRMVPSPNCVLCNVLHDNVHVFCECILVRESWFWIRQRLLGMLPDLFRMSSNFEFLNLMFESEIMDGEVVWLLGAYVQLVWDSVICKKKYLKLEMMKSELSMKYLTHQRSNMPNLGHIVGLHH